MNELMTVAAAHSWLPGAMLSGHHVAPQLPVDLTSAAFAAIVTGMDRWQNLKGIEESSDKALEVMKVTTVMVVILRSLCRDRHQQLAKAGRSRRRADGFALRRDCSAESDGADARSYALSEVLLLGGPNAFIPGMREAWQHKIPQLWQERGVKLPDGAAAEDLIRVPEDALYYGALGAIEFGRTEDEMSGLYTGRSGLEKLIGAHRGQGFEDAGGRGLCASDEERREFERKFQRPAFQPPAFPKGERVEAFLGIDGGSTSTKAVLLSTHGELLAKAYQLSKGNPIEDTIEVLGRLRAQVEEGGAHLAILGVGTTGYAKDVLRQVLQADVAVVETVAHAESAKHFFADPHVIVHVGVFW